MTRVRLEYSDQNESFASCLPRDGTILERIATSNAHDWYLIELDQSIDYQIKASEPANYSSYRLVETSHLLIQSRWANHAIGETEPTSVFLLLVELGQLPLVLPLDIAQYYRVAWGMCHTLGKAANQVIPGDAKNWRA